MSVCTACAAGKTHSELIRSVFAHDEAADAAVAAIRTSAGLAAKQQAWRAAWLESLGGLPDRTPLEARTTGVIRCDGYRIEKVLFQSQPGVYVTGLLYLPADPAYKAPYPGLLIVHGHSNEGKLRDGYRRMAILAVKAGFGVFAPDPISQGERWQCAAKYDTKENCSTEHSSLGARAWLVGWNFARFRLWDAVRSVDYMASRKELDLSKLAVAGNSGGGTMSAYLQAFDERVKVACPNCYVSSLREVIRERGCHDAEQFFQGQLKNGFNHAALVALRQPRVDLRGQRGQLPPSDDQSKRKYTTSYLALTCRGQCNEKINFAHGLGFAPFKPPYSFGAARSSVWRMLAKGHHDVRLTDAELRTFACWIDLAVPFCGSYVEHNDWNDWYRQRYEYTCNKRAAFAWLELNDIRKGLGLPLVPLTGFIPNVAEPRRQKYWSE